MLRRMVDADLPAALRLTQAQQWTHRREDWAFHFALARGWCVQDSEVVGTALWWDYGPALGSIGLVVVDSSRQGAGIGRQLMNAVIEDAAPRALLLNATDAGLRLYQQCGFAAIGRIEQRQAVPKLRERSALPEGLVLQPVQPGEIAQVIALDHSATGADRSALLHALASAGQTLLAWRAGKPVGYAIARASGLGTVIGPVVAGSEEDAQALLAHGVAMIGGFIRVDIPASAQRLSAWCERIGLPCVAQVTTMARGTLPVTDGSMRIYGLASQALG